MWKTNVLATGWKMPRIGDFPVTGIGEHPSQYGFQKIWKRWFAWEALRSCSNWVEKRLLISTGSCKFCCYRYQIVEVILTTIVIQFMFKVLMTSQSHPNKEKEFWEESPKFSIAGSSPVRCLMPSNIILLKSV